MYVRILTLLSFSWTILNCAPQEVQQNRRTSIQSLSDSDGRAQVQIEENAIETVDTQQSNQMVINEGSSLSPISLLHPVDMTGVPATFRDQIVSVHKISQTKTIFYTKDNQSWLYDETLAGSLVSLVPQIFPPANAIIYVLENNSFWLFGEETIAFPSVTPNETTGEVAILNFSPSIMSQADKPYVTHFMGADQLILGNDSQIALIRREGDTIFNVSFDLPKENEQPIQVISAGIGTEQDQFWFLSSDQLYSLKKGEDQKWYWLASKLNFDVSGKKVDPSMAKSVAMILDMTDEKKPLPVGTLIAWGTSQAFSITPIQLVIDDPETIQIFQNQVQPILSSRCASCHAGYDQLATVRAKAADFTNQISTGLMPPAPNPPLSDADRTAVLQWLQRLTP